MIIQLCQGFNTLKNKAARICEIKLKHNIVVRRCSRVITFILFQFYFSFISCCATAYYCD